MESQVQTMERETQELREAITHKLELIQGRISTIKDSVDLKKQTKLHPLTMVGTALLTGCVLGYVSTRRTAKPLLGKPSPTPGKLVHFLKRINSDYGAEIDLAKKVAVAAALRYGQHRLTRPATDH